MCISFKFWAGHTLKTCGFYIFKTRKVIEDLFTYCKKETVYGNSYIFLTALDLSIQFFHCKNQNEIYILRRTFF